MKGKNSYKGSKLYGMKHEENPIGKKVSNMSKGKIKNYSRNQKGR